MMVSPPLDIFSLHPLHLFEQLLVFLHIFHLFPTWDHLLVSLCVQNWPFVQPHTIELHILLIVISKQIFHFLRISREVSVASVCMSQVPKRLMIAVH